MLCDMPACICLTTSHHCQYKPSPCLKFNNSTVHTLVVPASKERHLVVEHAGRQPQRLVSAGAYSVAVPVGAADAEHQGADAIIARLLCPCMGSCA